jgi:hypothetical protein
MASSVTNYFQQSKTLEITLPDDEIEADERMIKYIYLADYDLTYVDYDAYSLKMPPLLLHVKVLKVADKYSVHGLQVLAEKKHVAALPTAIQNSIDDFTLSVAALYELPACDLRTCILKFAFEHTQDLLKIESFVTLFLENAELSLDLLGTVKPVWKVCPKCNVGFHVQPITKAHYHFMFVIKKKGGICAVTAFATFPQPALGLID